MKSYDAIVLGAGFFGLRIAQDLRQRGLSKVLIVEEANQAMDRASFVNQARVHNGYHYPRSILTGFRSRVSSQAFMTEYEPAIFRNFQHIYAIATNLSKTNAKQFEIFCNRIGAPLVESPPEIRDHFTSRLIEKSWVADEYAFDSRILRDLVLDKINSLGGIEIIFGAKAQRVIQASNGVSVELSDSTLISSPIVISSLYSATNVLHEASKLPLLPLQHEITEMALVRMPESWRNRALTVMDGPFFSLMPFPSAGLHTFSHVRYTPQVRWVDHQGQLVRQIGKKELDTYPSSFREMKADLCRYVSGMKDIEYVSSIREIKTVLAKNDLTDSRPIVIRSDFGLDGYHSVLGSKIDNVGDVLEELGIRIGV